MVKNKKIKKLKKYEVVFDYSASESFLVEAYSKKEAESKAWDRELNDEPDEETTSEKDISVRRVEE